MSGSHLTSRHMGISEIYYSISSSPFPGFPVTSDFFFFLFLPHILFSFLNKDELGYGDAYVTLMAGICSTDCQHMIACFFDQDVVALLRSFEFCFLFKYKEL